MIQSTEILEKRKKLPGRAGAFRPLFPLRTVHDSFPTRLKPLVSLYLHQLALRLACLSRRRHRVTTFHTSDNRCLRPVLSAGGSFARVGEWQRSPTYPPTILVQACQLLWLVQYDGSYKRSHMLAIASYPSTSPGGNLQEGFFLTVETPYRSTLAH